MVPQISGLHHVTAIASDPQQNLDFYAGALGLRLVKLTVNFDDPGTYHLYYGDDAGRPGTIMTFFPWPGASRGRTGAGQVVAVAFSIPTPSVEYWRERLHRHGVTVEGPKARFDEQALSFSDPDGLRLELVAPGTGDDRPGRRGGPVPDRHAVRGVHSVTMAERGHREDSRTVRVLTDGLGFHRAGESGDRVRYAAAGGGPGAVVDIVWLPGVPYGQTAAGTIHHIAWRTPDDAHQHAWRERIAGLGLNVTDVRDRTYFRSIYFREPGGVLFEIATDPPGFAVDEAPDALGSRLMLPEWLEPRRAHLERALPPLRIPTVRQAS